MAETNQKLTTQWSAGLRGALPKHYGF